MERGAPRMLIKTNFEGWYSIDTSLKHYMYISASFYPVQEYRHIEKHFSLQDIEHRNSFRFSWKLGCCWKDIFHCLCILASNKGLMNDQNKVVSRLIAFKLFVHSQMLTAHRHSYTFAAERVNQSGMELIPPPGFTSFESLCRRTISDFYYKAHNAKPFR